MKATFIKSQVSAVGADQRVYLLDPPLQYAHWEGDDVVEGFAKFVVVSANVVPFSGPETYIFRSDADGNIKNWNELPGSYKGGLDHDLALTYSGYEIVGLIDVESTEVRGELSP